MTKTDRQTAVMTGAMIAAVFAVSSAALAADRIQDELQVEFACMAGINAETPGDHSVYVLGVIRAPSNAAGIYVYTRSSIDFCPSSAFTDPDVTPRTVLSVSLPDGTNRYLQITLDAHQQFTSLATTIPPINNTLGTVKSEKELGCTTSLGAADVQGIEILKNKINSTVAELYARVSSVNAQLQYDQMHGIDAHHDGGNKWRLRDLLKTCGQIDDKGIQGKSAFALKKLNSTGDGAQPMSNPTDGEHPAGY